MTADASDKAGVIAPPPLIAVATLLAGLSLDWLAPVSLLRDALGLPARLAAGSLLIAGGLALALSAERAFRAIGTNPLPWKPATALASSGLYARTRNPMYLGLALVVFGIALALGSLWTLAMMIPGALVMHYGVVRREERYLENKFGDDYRAFMARVPRYGWRL
jgi:protein-S-isoprenylcysteine O-methyltransferase Ste14